MEIKLFLVISLNLEIFSLKKLHCMFFKSTFHKDYELNQGSVVGAELVMRKPQPGFSEAHCMLSQAYNYPSKQRSLK